MSHSTVVVGLLPPFLPSKGPPGVPELPEPPETNYLVVDDGERLALWRRVLITWRPNSQSVRCRELPFELIEIGQRRSRNGAAAHGNGAVAAGRRQFVVVRDERRELAVFRVVPCAPSAATEGYPFHAVAVPFDAIRFGAAAVNGHGQRRP